MYIAEKELAIETQLWPGMVELMMQSVDLPDAGDLLRRPNWQAQSACRDQDMNEFFPDGTGISREVHRICAGCPVSVVEGSVGRDIRARARADSGCDA